MPALIAQYGLILVAVIIFCGEIGLPTLIPGEIALLIAGSQIDHSLPALIAAVAVFGSVDVLATSTIHIVARTGGNRALLSVMRRLQPGAEQRHEEVVERWRQRLGGRDSAVVFVTRLIPMFRLYASITTGLIRIRLRHFFRGAVPAAYLWAATPLTLGYIFRGRIQGLESHFGLLMHGVVVASVLVFVVTAMIFGARRGGLSSRALGPIRVMLGSSLVTLGTYVAVTVVGKDGYTQSVIPAVSALPSRGIALCLLAIGLLWAASHGLPAIYRSPAAGGIARFRTTARLALAVMAITVTTFGNIHAAGYVAARPTTDHCVQVQGGALVSTHALRRDASLCQWLPGAPRS